MTKGVLGERPRAPLAFWEYIERKGGRAEHVVSSAAERPPDVRQPDLSREASEQRFGHLVRLVLALALALIALSAAQKAYRLSLPTDGWSTTNADFERDDPVYLENLAGKPTPLRPGDRLIAVEGVPFTELELRSLRGQATDVGYEAGRTVRYTVVREGREVDLEVPLYPGSSIGPGKVFPLLFAETQVGGVLLWVAVAVAVFVFWKRPGNLTAQLLFLQMFVTLASAISWLVAPLNAADALHPGTFYLAAFFTHWVHALLEQPLGLHLILSFPRPAPVLQKPWALPLLYGLPLVAFALMFSLPDGNGAPMFGLVGLYNLLGIVAVVRLFFVFRDPVGRAQVRWFGFGYAVSNLGTLLFALWAAGIVPDSVNRVTEALPFNLVFLLCTGIAVLRYRLFDIDVILNRTLVWGGLTAGVVGLYALVVGGVGRLVGVGDHDVGLSLVATGLVAVAFSPLRTLLQRSVNRLLYGDRDEPYKVLSSLSAGTSGLSSITGTLGRALKLPYVAVALGQGENLSTVAEYGRSGGTPVALPLVYRSEQLGELRLEPRANEARFSASERGLLEVVAQQTSVVAYAASLNRALQGARERLVGTREEERRRLRRDLHDGLGPTLAGLIMQLDRARGLARTDPEAADTLLVALKTQAQSALSDIRRLVYALRPPALDELGLLGALRAQAERLSGPGLAVVLDAPDALPPLPAATEVAVYRIAQEALANVVRHARAEHAEVRLTVGEGLGLNVTDDGGGFSGASSGVGLHAMRERAEELGGVFTLTTGPKQGTRVSVTLPLAPPGTVHG